MAESKEEKIKEVNEKLALSQAKTREGDQLFQQFMFDQSKMKYMEACDVLMKLIKATNDDQNFTEYLK